MNANCSTASRVENGMLVAFSSSKLAIDHWNRTLLLISEEERYFVYPWLYEAAQFRRHAGEQVLRCTYFQAAWRNCGASTPIGIIASKDTQPSVTPFYRVDW